MVKFTYDSFQQTSMDVTLHTRPLYGIEKVMGEDDSLPTAPKTIKFVVYDDDGEVMGGGFLEDDPECENQSAALRFAEAEWGCTTIKVLRDGGWKQEIG